MARLLFGASGLSVNASTTEQVAAVVPLSIQYAKDFSGKIIGANNIIDFNNATGISNELFKQKYKSNSTIYGDVALDTIIGITGESSCDQMFQKCPNITSVSFDNLAYISGNRCCSEMFSECTGIETVIFNNLIKVSGEDCCSSMFNKCTSLREARFPKLCIIEGQQLFGIFWNCSSMSDVYFNNVSESTFEGENKSQFYQLLLGTTGCTIHLPANLDPSVISELDQYPNFGGTDSIILFDLDEEKTIEVIADDGTVLYNMFGDEIASSYPTEVTVKPNDKIIGISSDGLHVFQYTFDSELETGDSVDLTLENIDFVEYTFATPDDMELNLDLDVTSDYFLESISNPISSTDVLYVSGSLSLIINSSVVGDYMILNKTVRTKNEDTTVNIAVYEVDGENVRIYNASNFKDYIEPSIEGDENWEITNNQLVIHPNEGEMLRAYRSITLDNLEHANDVIVQIRAYASTEEWGSYAFVSLGTDLIEPEEWDIEERTIPAGEGQYLFVQKGNSNTMQTYNITLNNIDPQQNILTIGYISEGYAFESEDKFHIESISIIPIKPVEK